MKCKSLIPSPVIAVGCLGLLVVALTGCSTTSSPKLARYEEAERIGSQHLAVFDTLDFDVYTNQKWERFSESHA